MSSCKYSCTLRALVQRFLKVRRPSFVAVGTMLMAAGTTCAGALLQPPRAAARAISMARVARACPGSTVRPAGTDAAAVEQATLCMVNRIRANHHLPALRANSTLDAVAGSQVSSMVRLDYFADVRPSGQTPMALVSSTPYAHSAYVSIGQNIAWGTGGQADASSIVLAWMNSPPHRRIILTSQYRDAGVAVTPSVPAVVGAGSSGATYAMEFGVRKP